MRLVKKTFKRHLGLNKHLSFFQAVFQAKGKDNVIYKAVCGVRVHLLHIAQASARFFLSQRIRLLVEGAAVES